MDRCFVLIWFLYRMSLYNICCSQNHGYPNSVFLSARISRNRFSAILKKSQKCHYWCCCPCLHWLCCFHCLCCSNCSCSASTASVSTAAASGSTASAVSTDSDVLLIQHLLIWQQEGWICGSLEPWTSWVLFNKRIKEKFRNLQTSL